MHHNASFFKHVIIAGISLFLSMVGVSSWAKGAPSVQVLTERCSTEAREAGMGEGGEFSKYVKECVREMQDMRKQGIDLDGSHEDPSALAPVAKPKSAAKGKVKNKGKAKARSKKKKKKKS